MTGNGLAFNHLLGARTAAAVVGFIARNQLHVATFRGDSDPIRCPRNGREVEHHDHLIVAVASKETHNRRVPVVEVDPLEALGVRIGSPQARSRAIQASEILQITHEFLTLRVLRKVPIETRCVVPLGMLRQFRPHEHELLAGTGRLIQQE